MFLNIICLEGNSRSNGPYLDELGKKLKASENRLQELLTVIKSNLQGTSVYEQFLKEQELWEKYRDAHIETLYPGFIDGTKMLWGSIEGYGSAQEILKMNLDRIRVLESFLNHEHESGTDGMGLFKEYVEELRRVYSETRQ